LRDGQNSLIQVHEAYKNYHGALFQIAPILLGGFPNFQNHFAPVPEENDEAIQILLDLIGLGLVMGGGAFFNSFLAKLPYFIAHAATQNNLKDGSYAFIATGISIAKDLTGSGTFNWKEEKRVEFTGTLVSYINRSRARHPTVP